MIEGHKESPLRPFDEAYAEAVALGGGILDTRLTLPSGITKTLAEMTRADLGVLIEVNKAEARRFLQSEIDALVRRRDGLA